MAENIPSVESNIKSSDYTLRSKHIISGIHDKNDRSFPFI